MVEAPNLIGRVVDNRYVVEAVIGQGGMGVVLRARHKFTGAQVALKMLNQEFQGSVEVQERFLAEARTPSTIGHPNIVQVLDAGTTPQGELYFAMELLTGRTLRQALFPSVPPQVARRIALELLDALGAAHAHGIIHRDLKPENVFLAGAAGTVKLLDFGIAKAIQTARTHQGQLLGTLSYMSPEQLMDASSVDARTDLWAVGVVVYEMLSGQLPFRATTLVDMIQAFHSRDADPIRMHLPPSTPWLDKADAFFARALARDRARRFSSSQELAGVLSTLGLDDMQIATAGSTLTGVMASRGSNVMTAADSGPVLPRTGSTPIQRPRPPTPSPPQSGSPGQPFAVAASPSAPFAVPQSGSPSQPFAVPSPSAPFAVPASPSRPDPVPASPSQPFAPPGGVYGAAGPLNSGPQWGTAPPAPAQGSSLGKSSWIVLGIVAVAFVGFIFVFLKLNSDHGGDVEKCAETCKVMRHCGETGNGTSGCEELCTVMTSKTVDCVESSGSSCDTFRTCVLGGP